MFDGALRGAATGGTTAMSGRVVDRYHGGYGEPLVLLHGVAMSSRVWEPVLAELERHHAVYVPTLAGHRGGTALTAGAPADVDDLVDVLCGELDEAGITTAHVVGNSLGGWLALELARRGRARSVVALSPACGWAQPVDLLRLILGFRLGLALGRSPWVRMALRHPSTRRLMLLGALEHGDRVSSADALAMLDDFRGCEVLEGLLSNAGGRARMTPLDDPGCPIRVAWATRDRTIPYRRFGRPIRRLMPTAEFVRLPDVGHVPMYDDPALVCRTILGITASAPRREAG